MYAETLAKRTRKSEGRLFHVDGPTTEKARRCHLVPFRAVILEKKVGERLLK